MRRASWGWGLAAAVIALLLLISLVAPRGRPGELPLEDFTAALRAGQVATANIQYQNNTALLSGKLEDGQEYRTRTLAADPAISLPRLQAAGVNVSLASNTRLSPLAVLSGLLTLLLIIGLVVLLLRGRQSGGTDAASTFSTLR